ncbi:uncharacterized protein [Palaemon carinicauda]|uniref:uncharacterized protein n=1 Tax=Palaemon carinicauda TaxID=392227 RepID=UPI0035B5B833
MWTTLVQCCLVGKAQRVYNNLSDDLSADYDTVKSIVLKAYDLVPEAYRQKFRNLRKYLDVTYIEFSRKKGQFRDDRLKSKGVDNFVKLKELFLVEEFKRNVSRELRIHLEELKLDSIQEISVASDEYTLTHREEPLRKRINQDRLFPHEYNTHNLQEKLLRARSFAQEHLAKPQASMKLKYDVKTRDRLFNVGDKVLVLLPMPGNPLKAEFVGPWKVLKKINNVNYLIETPDRRRKNHICHVNTIKSFTERSLEESVLPISVVSVENEQFMGDKFAVSPSGLENNSDVLNNLNTKFQHLDAEKPAPLINIIDEYEDLFQDSPGRTHILQYDVDVGKAQPIIKQCPYRLNPLKREIVRKEVKYMLDHNLVKPSCSPWSFPVVLVRKEDDASDTGLGAVLLQEGENGTSHPVAYFSKKLLPAERRYSTIKKEALCLVKAIIHFEVYSSSSMHYLESEEAEVANFLASLNWEEDLFKLKRDQLWLIAEFLDLSLATEVGKGPSLFEVSKAARIYRETLDRKDVLESSRLDESKPGEIEELEGGGKENLIDNSDDHLEILKEKTKMKELEFKGLQLRADERAKEREHEIELLGKSNKKIPKAPLIPIPSVGEPFREVIIDVVGPLLQTRGGNEYILSIVDRMSRFPEAIPLRSIRSKKVVEVLVDFFTRFSFPKVIQSDCGTNFRSRCFEKKMNEFGIEHIRSALYHPESQGQVEMFHQTLKSVLKKFCLETGNDSDKELPYALFATRSITNESMGLSPFQLIFSHCVRGPLDVVREHLEGETKLMYWIIFSDLQEKLLRARSFAQEHLAKPQALMKLKYDVKTRDRLFNVGDKVLVLLPMSGNSLKAEFVGPWKVLKKINNVNYLIETPDRRRKTHICHVNTIKTFTDRSVEESVVPISVHLDAEKPAPLINLINEYEDLFQDAPGYWQVGLTPRARKISAFVTGDGLYECEVMMPFGMKNAAATFQRLMNFITCELEGRVVYIDDLVIYSDDWETHLKRTRALFEMLKKAGLVINLKKE